MHHSPLGSYQDDPLRLEADELESADPGPFMRFLTIETHVSR